MIRVATLLLVTIAMPHKAIADTTLFKCERGGRTIYSDNHCGPGAKIVQPVPYVGNWQIAIAVLDDGVANQYKAEGKLNGRQATFVVDTGAELTSIPKSQMAKYNLDGECVPLEFSTANGKTNGCVYKGRSQLETSSLGL